MPTLAALLDTAPLAPHGTCLMWRPELIWLHVVSDALIGLSYFSIPAALLVFLWRRRDLVFPSTFALFAAFILACGSTHFMHIWTLWVPDYGLEGMVKAATALVSVATAATLWPLLPKALALPSPAALAREVEVRREAEARARASEARLGDVFEHLPDGLFVVSLRPGEDGGFVYEQVNSGFERLFGLPRARLLGRGPREVFDLATAEALERCWAECVARGAPVEYEAAGRTPNGHRQWHAVVVPLRGGGGADADGRVTKLLGSARDVTEMRRLQTDLQETARLATIGSMCAGVAHEMSQPLNIVALWGARARAMLDGGAGAGGADPALLRRVLDIVLDQTRRMGTLLERMRDLTRQTPGPAEPFDAGAAAADAVEVARRRYGLEGLSMEFTPAGVPVLVLGQRAQLEQALLQLLGNARDAVATRRAREPEAPALIRIAVRPEPEAERVAIEVRDSGGGVPPALRGRIFDPFFTTKEPGQGTGLGLAIAQGIARAMGGRLQTWNADTGMTEAGAVFRLTLPLLGPARRRERAVVASAREALA